MPSDKYIPQDSLLLTNLSLFKLNFMYSTNFKKAHNKIPLLPPQDEQRMLPPVVHILYTHRTPCPHTAVVPILPKRLGVDKAGIFVLDKGAVVLMNMCSCLVFVAFCSNVCVYVTTQMASFGKL